MLVAGIQSGTSTDGIDVCIVEISDTPINTTKTHSNKPYNFEYKISLKCYETIKWENEDRQSIFELMHGERSAQSFCKVNFMIGRRFANAIQKVMEKHKIEKIDLIGSHGQTIWHECIKDEFGNIKVDSTFQLGESSIIAHQLNVPVIHDFRVADVAVGGQGAPLTSILDFLLLRRKDGKWRAVQNIGGMGNVTFIPPDASPEKVIAFDTGPGNVLIDEGVKLATNGKMTFDKDGNMAKNGKVNQELLKKILSLEYFQQNPPKTTGRELFSPKMAREFFEYGRDKLGMSNDDIISTFTQVTVDSILLSYKNFAPTNLLGDVVIGGGGRDNPEIMKRLREGLNTIYGKDVLVVGHEELEEMGNHPLASEAKEAILFALLAYLNHKGRTGNLPSVTGAKKEVILGKLTLPN